MMKAPAKMSPELESLHTLTLAHVGALIKAAGMTTTDRLVLLVLCEIINQRLAGRKGVFSPLVRVVCDAIAKHTKPTSDPDKVMIKGVACGFKPQNYKWN